MYDARSRNGVNLRVTSSKWALYTRAICTKSWYLWSLLSSTQLTEEPLRPFKQCPFFLLLSTCLILIKIKRRSSTLCWKIVVKIGFEANIQSCQPLINKCLSSQFNAKMKMQFDGALIGANVTIDISLYILYMLEMSVTEWWLAVL